MIAKHFRFGRVALLAGVVLLLNSARAELPDWIWQNGKSIPGTAETRFFRKTFNLEKPVTKALLSVTGDASMQVYLNGRLVINSTNSEITIETNVTDLIDQGENVIAIHDVNDSGNGMVIALLELDVRKAKQFVWTDTSWKCSSTEAANWNTINFNDAGWGRVFSRGKLGLKPWGDVFQLPQATPAEELTVLPGFKAELIRSAQPGEGSWICMTVDPQGRLIISPQEGVGNLLRITLTRKGEVKKVEKIDLPVGDAMGLLYAFHGLYLNGMGPDGTGIYYLPDTNRADRYTSVELIKHMYRGEGEHGSHAIVLGPDKKLYIVSGNFTKVPDDISPDSPHKNFAEDQLLPRGLDGNGFGNEVKPPGGFILRTDADGKKWQLFAAGMRNTYDFAFNPDGEMIGFDSDMEWDWGMPWYRPIRIFHLVSGGDYGFREGTGKWPEYYPDSLPAMLDVGIGSPTGMKFGTQSKFPPRYKKALYALDWTYGRIFAVHLTPNGASYTASAETLLKGKPLNLTDVEFGRDGAMYFITGGRGIQSGLYRVSYVGEKVKENPEASEELARDKAAAAARALRHKLEIFQGRRDPQAVDFAWPYLDSGDRFIRYAARIAIESQPAAEWRDRALSETRTNAGITALLALARCGGRETQNDLLQALTKFPLDGLTEGQQLEKLRVIELSFIRQGRPEPALAKMATERLDRHYPAKDEWLNRELCELLIYLKAPDVVAKTMALLDAAPTQEEQIHYIFHLRMLTNGWTLPQREEYFNWLNSHQPTNENDPTYVVANTNYPWATNMHTHPAQMLQWFEDAGRDYDDGSSYPKFMAYFHKDAVDSLNAQEKKELAVLITPHTNDFVQTTARPFVKDWKMEDLQPLLDQVSKGRSFSQGKRAFQEAQCIRCHRFGNNGGAVGPELTGISSRYSRRDILESILEPSKVVSEQYQDTIIVTKDGDDVSGRIAEENDKKLVVITNPLTESRTEVLKSNIESRVASKVSPMPDGLVNCFTREEILDLLAYLESAGKHDASMFKP